MRWHRCKYPFHPAIIPTMISAISLKAATESAPPYHPLSSEAKFIMPTSQVRQGHLSERCNRMHHSTAHSQVKQTSSCQQAKFDRDISLKGATECTTLPPTLKWSKLHHANKPSSTGQSLWKLQQRAHHPTTHSQVKQTSSCQQHTGKCIRRFGGIYAYCRYFIDRKW